jgi:hypothetical protein
MQHTASFNTDLHVIEVIFHGEITISDFHEILEKVAKLTVDRNCFLWIMDYRTATINLNAFDMAHFVFAIRNICESIGDKAEHIKRANIIPSNIEEPHLLNSLMMSNLHNKRVKQFNNYHDALSWLYMIENNQSTLGIVGKPHQLITIQVAIQCNVKTVWRHWNSVDSISEWFMKSEKWATSSIVHNLVEGGVFDYCIETKDKKYQHHFSGHFQHIFKEKLIIYALDDGRIQKAIFHPYKDETIVTETLEADELNMLAQQQKSWQDILESFKKFVEEKSITDLELLDDEIKD